MLIQSIPQVPVFCNVLWKTRDAARSAPRADVELAYCARCGHWYNRIFDSNRLAYGLEYENSLHFSPRFQEYAAWLAHRLVDRHDLHGKTILEIGSGKADFLKLLVESGSNHGIGYDPSYIPTPEDQLDDRVKLICGTFDHLDDGEIPDLIYSRHTLEHLEDPRGFIKLLRTAIGMHLNTSIFIEVPNVDLIIKDLSIWDIIYEHFSYFSESSLGHLVEANGFSVEELMPTYQGQFLIVDAYPVEPVAAAGAAKSSRAANYQQELERFSSEYAAKIQNWTDRLEDFHKQGKTVVLWGAGSKGVMFLNLLPNAQTIQWVVDVNPRKTRMFVSGAGQEIVQPERLTDIRPDVIVVMNPIYANEIRATVRSLGLEPELINA
ncbi:MAG TPA: class I SAM-dependent methyltransferase [Anaerolineaceae bacterium]|nr:class I SAM-dependent methyltransferase [Anaerolineaceae bacterium]